MIKALITAPVRESDMEHFMGIEGVECVYAKVPTDEQLAEAEVMIGNPPAAVAARAPKLKWLQSTSAGVNDYTSHPELFDNGLVLTGLSGAFGQSISEFCLTMCLMMYKHMHFYRDNQAQHNWHDEGMQDSPVGKELLILGAGNIGCETARLFSMFCCHTTGLRRTVREVPEYFDEMITLDGLDEALKKADIVVAALPETPETHKLLNAERLHLMKKTALLINVGRGTLIDCDELAAMLERGELQGAALDVTDPEPLPADHPLWSCRRAIVTPHITGGSFGHLKATEDILFDICFCNLKRYAAGEQLLNVIDTATGYRTTDNRY